MNLSSKLRIVKVDRRQPQDKEEWLGRVARVLLQGRKKEDTSVDTKTKKPRK